MKTVFSLKNSDGSDRTGLQPSVRIYKNIGGVLTVVSGLNEAVTELSYGDYELSFDEPTDSYDYLRIYVYLPVEGILTRFTAYPDSPSLEDIASTVLSTDVCNLSVDENAYTVTHLIMASQNSQVELVNNKHVWKIFKGDENDTIIATRELTLNDNGAIVQTK